MHANDAHYASAATILLVGGVFGSALLVRKVFTFQAVSPLIYNIAIILGGVLLGKSMGVSSLAVGVVAGAFLGYLT